MRIATGLLLSVLASGCASMSSPEPLPFLPLLAPPPPGTETIAHTALISGRLVVERGCVRLAHRDRSTTMIWHRGTELGRDRSGLFLRETHNGQVVRFGVQTGFGGGEMPQRHVEEAYPDVAQRCGPPYASGWISD